MVFEMKSGFTTSLKAELKDGSDKVWIILAPLKYYSELLSLMIIVPPWFESESPELKEDAFFETDYASVPRVPIAYNMWGDRAHREATLHDYLYRVDSAPVVERAVADKVFREAMVATGKPYYIYAPMYWGVRLGGGSSYHKKKVRDKL
jgi:hypothetical protein